MSPAAPTCLRRCGQHLRRPRNPFAAASGAALHQPVPAVQLGLRRRLTKPAKAHIRHAAQLRLLAGRLTGVLVHPCDAQSIHAARTRCIMYTPQVLHDARGGPATRVSDAASYSLTRCKQPIRSTPPPRCCTTRLSRALATRAPPSRCSPSSCQRRCALILIHPA